MAFNEDGCATSDEFRKRFAEMFGDAPAPNREVVLGQDLKDVKERLEAELDKAERARDRDGEVDLSITRADVLRRAYTERYV